MEYDLKASIAEEYRTQLLQAVEEQYYYGWGMFDDGWLQNLQWMVMLQQEQHSPSTYTG